eukprot:jgi/Psemu1/15895/gm1.15895_g
MSYSSQPHTKQHIVDEFEHLDLNDIAAHDEDLIEPTNRYPVMKKKRGHYMCKEKGHICPINKRPCHRTRFEPDRCEMVEAETQTDADLEKLQPSYVWVANNHILHDSFLSDPRLLRKQCGAFNRHSIMMTMMVQYFLAEIVSTGTWHRDNKEEVNNYRSSSNNSMLEDQ